MVVIAVPEQEVWDAGVATAFGTGFTVTVAVIAVPGQVRVNAVNEGVIKNDTVIGAFVVLVNEPLMSPVPFAGMPVTVPVLSRDQLYDAPGTLPFITIVVIAEPEQVVCAGGVATAFGTGFTVTVAVIGVPVQVLPALVYDGVIVKVTVTGALVVFVKEPLISPLPLAAILVTVPLAASPLSLVQLYTVPGTLPVNAMVVIAVPEQEVCDAGVATAFGTGFTVIVNVFG
jgi:hypothetical protein